MYMHMYVYVVSMYYPGYCLLSQIKASIAKTQQKSRIQKQGMRGGFKVEKQSENSNKNSQPKSSKKKGVLNKHPSKNKVS